MGLRQITVLGMHRSGTSAMAGHLSIAGAWAGDPEQLMPAGPFNALGYFERRDTADALDDLLHQLGGVWSAPPLGSLNRLSLEPHRDRLRGIFDTVAAGVPEGRIPLVKDPRLSLFASELPTILGSSEGIVVCVRHPLAVARSLRRSEGIPLTTGLALWELYNATICTGLSGRAVRVRAFGPEHHDQMKLDSFVDDVFSAFGCVPRKGLESANVVPGLIHGFADAEDEQQWLSAAQVSLWQALAEAARSPQPTALESVELSALAAQELGRSTAAELEGRETVKLKQELVELTAEQTAVVAQVEALAGEKAALVEQLDVLLEEKRRAAGWATEKEAQWAAGRQTLQQLQAELDAARAEAGTFREEAAGAVEALQVETAASAALMEELEVERHSADQLRETLASVEAAQARLTQALAARR